MPYSADFPYRSHNSNYDGKKVDDGGDVFIYLDEVDEEGNFIDGEFVGRTSIMQMVKHVAELHENYHTGKIDDSDGINTALGIAKALREAADMLESRIDNEAAKAA